MTLDEAAEQLPEGYTLTCQRREPRCRVWLDTPSGQQVQFFRRSWRVAVQAAVVWARE